MSQRQPLQRDAALIALLERDFGRGRASGLAGRTSTARPGRNTGSNAPSSHLEQPHGQSPVLDHLCEQALLAPVREFLGRPSKGFRGRLVRHAWALAGGEPGQLPAELPLAVEVLHAGSLIVDDIQDQSETRRGRPALHHLYGTPLALNTGNWLYFWSLQLMTRGLPDRVATTVQRRAVSTMLYCHQGQALDLSTRVCDLDRADVAETVAMATGLKTGALMEFAAWLGAVACQAPLEQCEALARAGYQLGVGLQMLDDLGGLVAPSRRQKGLEDVRLARLTWPWAWLAEYTETGTFSRLQKRTRELAESTHGDTAQARRPEKQLRDGRAGTNGSSHPADDAGQLADEMARIVADLGRDRVHRHLSTAFAELRRSMEPLAAGRDNGKRGRQAGQKAGYRVESRSIALAELEREINRLEVSYG
ncbi:MAG: polyprenyl synthetase family protein [Proteobacteria bacterium]|nr:polyprenyl synthetase family protein [Pseudomonadota bacterium]